MVACSSRSQTAHNHIARLHLSCRRGGGSIQTPFLDMQQYEMMEHNMLRINIPRKVFKLKCSSFRKINRGLTGFEFGAERGTACPGDLVGTACRP